MTTKAGMFALMAAIAATPMLQGCFTAAALGVGVVSSLGIQSPE